MEMRTCGLHVQYTERYIEVCTYSKHVTLEVSIATFKSNNQASETIKETNNLVTNRDAKKLQNSSSTLFYYFTLKNISNTV